MSKPTLAVVHNNIDDRSSIGAIAAWDVRQALARGWEVVAVCRDLDPELAAQVRWQRLYVPPRSHLIQYALGRKTVARALRGHAPDVLLVHQPQLAAVADIWNVHYLERAARDVRGSVRRGLKPRVQDWQGAGVAALEDRYLRALTASTRVLFCGDGLARDFARLYGTPPNSRVVYNPALRRARPAAGPLPDRARRRELVGDHPGPVVGFLGGGDSRKGADLVATAVAADDSLFLVHAGPTDLDVTDPRLRGRHRPLGNLTDVTTLLDVVDALLVPSRFDPFPLVVAEAAARGVPLLVSEAVGSASLVTETGAGLIWNGREPLRPALDAVLADRATFVEGGGRLVARLDPDRLADERFAEIDAVRERKLWTRS